MLSLYLQQKLHQKRATIIRTIFVLSWLLPFALTATVVDCLVSRASPAVGPFAAGECVQLVFVDRQATVLHSTAELVLVKWVTPTGNQHVARYNPSEVRPCDD